MMTTHLPYLPPQSQSQSLQQSQQQEVDFQGPVDPPCKSWSRMVQPPPGMQHPEPQPPQPQDDVFCDEPTTTATAADHDDDDDDMEVTSVRHYCWDLLVKQVGGSSVVLIVYLVCAMEFSSLYWMGLIAALGVAMMVQGGMRHWSAHTLQQEYTSSTNAGRVVTVPGVVLHRYTDGWDPIMTPESYCGSLPTATTTCDLAGTGTTDAETNTSHMNYRAWPESSQPPPQPQQQQLPPPDGLMHWDADAAAAAAASSMIVGSLHTIVVQYHAHVPPGYVRSDGHVIQSPNVMACIVKEFPKVHPELYYNAILVPPSMASDQPAPPPPVSSTNPQGGEYSPRYSSTPNHNTGPPAGHDDSVLLSNPEQQPQPLPLPVVNITYRVDEPKSGYPQLLLTEEYTPHHQNGRLWIGFGVWFLAVWLSATLWPWSMVEWIAMLANLLLCSTVGTIVYHRSMDKHQAFWQGDTARILAWFPASHETTTTVSPSPSTLLAQNSPVASTTHLPTPSPPPSGTQYNFPLKQPPHQQQPSPSVTVSSSSPGIPLATPSPETQQQRQDHTTKKPLLVGVGPLPATAAATPPPPTTLPMVSSV